MKSKSVKSVSRTKKPAVKVANKEVKPKDYSHIGANYRKRMATKRLAARKTATKTVKTCKVLNSRDLARYDALQLTSLISKALKALELKTKA